jgi:hypothetical protein
MLSNLTRSATKYDTIVFYSINGIACGSKDNHLSKLPYLRATKKLKRMKFSLLTIAVFISLVMFSSCAKDTTGVIVHEDSIFLKDTIVLHDTPSNTPYYVKATINGVDYTYKGYTAALQTINYLNIYGANNNSSASDGITLFLRFLDGNSDTSPNPIIPAGTYTDTSGYYNSTYAGDASDLDPYDGSIYLQQLGIQYQDIPYISAHVLQATPPFICTITAISDSSVSGTFSGTAYFNNNNTSPKLITNGSFYVPF